MEVNSNDYFTVFFTLYSEADKGDVFTLKARPGYHDRYGSLQTQDSPFWKQSKVNVAGGLSYIYHKNLLQ